MTQTAVDGFFVQPLISPGHAQIVRQVAAPKQLVAAVVSKARKVLTFQLPLSPIHRPRFVYYDMSRPFLENSTQFDAPYE